jgi:lipopolysaccharide export system protein LptC
MAADSSPPGPPSAPLGARADERARWRDRSRAIRFWRRALPMVIVGIVALLVLWIGGRSAIVKLTSSNLSKETGGVRMVNPRFYGRDTHDRAFVVGAAEAARDAASGHTVTLKAPSVTLDAGGANPTRVAAARGVYREDEKRLNLTGQVDLQDGRGYHFTTPKAVVDTSTGRVTGDSGVRGEGPLGQIAASSYGVYDRGRRIVLKGDVHAHIVQ